MRRLKHSILALLTVKFGHFLSHMLNFIQRTNYSDKIHNPAVELVVMIAGTFQGFVVLIS
jgi:hypothetical protein